MQENHGLYVVATPIGNLHDITLRAIEVLKTVDVIAAEDTRHSGKLLQHLGICTPMISCHDHNEKAATQQLLKFLHDGKRVALITDAGTPLISDPGFYLVQQVRQAGYRIIPVPGASALIAALSVSGLPAHRFVFEGFLPAKSSARKEALTQCIQENRTVIFYESPHRILASVADMQAVLGDERYIVIARELTKTYETIYGGSLIDVAHWINEDVQQQKGEFVILIAPADAPDDHALTEAARGTLQILLAELPLKQAVKLAAAITGISKNSLYEYALTQEHSAR